MDGRTWTRWRPWRTRSACGGALAALVLAAACVDETMPTTPVVETGGPSFSLAGQTAVTVSVGRYHTCALTAANDAYCWGLNNTGQLGTGGNADSNVPVAVSGGLHFQTVSLGSSHTCGVTTTEEAYCWGRNAPHGQLGVSNSIGASNLPLSVSGGHAFQSVVASGDHTCGLTTDGATYCWGINSSGQLGTGNTASSDAPVLVVGGHSFEALATNSSHTCGLDGGGAALCWGNNTSGQLGNGVTGGTSATPVAVTGGIEYTALTTGASHTCGLSSAGPAYCWGYNAYGQLGTGTTGGSSAIPVAVAGGLSFVSLAAGELHTCGLTSSGQGYCWGLNSFGRLGDGSATLSDEPVPVAGGLTFESLGSGGSHTCAIEETPDIYCWGYNSYGQLGNGSNVNSNVPVAVFDAIADDDTPPITAGVLAAPNPVAVGSSVVLTAIVDDTGLGDSPATSAEYSVDGGPYLGLSATDGAFDEPVEDAQVGFSAPSEPGIYDVCVRGTDEHDNVGAPECVMLVVYDPSAGFVTGGGWIDSPEGALEVDPFVTGKANFGFVSRYKKGANVPTGSTEFRFKAGDLDFHSSAYEFLVITMGGRNAQFRGFGTVNGAVATNGDPYRFMIWATDDQPDTFRIKIWHEDGGEVVLYDNGFGQELGGGSIVIHTK